MPEPVLLHPRADVAELSRCAPHCPTAWESIQRRLEYEQYSAMRHAFGPSGGIVSGDELAGLLRSRSWQPISLLARWIVGRAVVNFEWQSATLLPIFQFDLASMTMRPRVSEVLQELTDVFDDWEVSLWFARPNAWLDDRAPVAVLGPDPISVLEAARADRYIARG